MPVVRCVPRSAFEIGRNLGFLYTSTVKAMRLKITMVSARMTQFVPICKASRTR